MGWVPDWCIPLLLLQPNILLNTSTVPVLADAGRHATRCTRLNRPEPGRNQSQPGRNPSSRLIITPGHAPVYSIPCLLYKSLVTSHSDVASRAGIWFYLDFDLKSQILHIFRRTVTRTFAEVMFLS